MKCSECGAKGDGAYCAACGAPLGGARCRRCDAALPGGARYCTRCGTAVRALRDKWPWLAGGVLAGVVLTVAAAGLLGLSFDGPTSPPEASFSAVNPGPAPGAGPGPLTGTPREQADRLFNRIMQENEAGDTARANFFLPMAIQAYGMAEPLDADGYYHRGLLHLLANDAASANADAQRILAEAPDHVFGLTIAAQAAQRAGDAAAARAHYQKLLRAFDAESGRDRPEYRDHARILPQYREEAERFVGGG